MPSLLMRLLVDDLSGYDPRIVELEKPIMIVGMSVETTLKKIYRDVPALGLQFKELKRAHPIPNKKEPWAFAAVSRGYDPTTGAMTYMMGDVVTSIGAIPEGMQAFEIPAIQYAVFPVRPKNPAGWGLAIANAKGYAYTSWMPRSGYEPAGIIDDFEYHDERAERKRNPEIDLYVAIKPKSTPKPGGAM
jgi:predicted transcriptional regulator YdeE